MRRDDPGAWQEYLSDLRSFEDGTIRDGLAFGRGRAAPEVGRAGRRASATQSGSFSVLAAWQMAMAGWSVACAAIGRCEAEPRLRLRHGDAEAPAWDFADGGLIGCGPSISSSISNSVAESSHA